MSRIAYPRAGHVGALAVWLVASALTLAAGCSKHDEARPATPSLPTATVRVQTIEARKRIATEEVVGTVRAKLQARLEAKVAGRIEELRAAPGQSVKAGELLVRLDVREIRAKLDQALAVRQQAVADLQRHTALLERGAATRAEFDAVQSRARVAEAAVQEAETLLGHAAITAPFAGVITRKLADVGDLAA
ncbi:MAG TPA: biotin/lipoyl-binding protein, partial [Methylomirabilota bacterium]|nr:biotin/lipoyl-binding protein [Methylomirabilota bacterium]